MNDNKMEEHMRILALGLAALLLFAPTAQAEMSGGKIKIGVLTDLSGPYEQNSGVGSVEAAKMAAEEFGNKVNGVPVEIVSGDHQNKPDIGAAIARRWFDLEGVDAVTDLVNSAVGFAVLEIAKTNNKAVLLTSAGSADFTGKACAPNTSVHWVYDATRSARPSARRCRSSARPGSLLPPIMCSAARCRKAPPPSSRRTAA